MKTNSSVFDVKGKRIGIFVIAYNAEKHIERTLNRIPEKIRKAVSMIYVIDDCSVDETVGKALSFHDFHNKVTVLRNRVNQMYGGNQKIGYQYAIEQNLDIVVLLHADGQYAPEYLELLLNPIIENKAEIVIGSRMLGKKNALKGGMPLYKFISNIILTKVQNLLSGANLSEFHSGYRAYSVNFLKNIPFWDNTSDWHFDTEILFQAIQGKYRIFEVPIPTYYGDEICHVNGIFYGINCILESIKYYLYRRGIIYSRIYDIDKKGIKYLEKFSDPFSSHTKILKKLKSLNLAGKKVLELGVGDASLTKKTFEMGAIVDGIEINPVSAKLAEPYCRRVFETNLEGIEKINLDEQYDIIIAADVLEHLNDPEYILSKIKVYLKKNGLMVVSLPNAVNLYVRINVLLGRFPYHTKGILDKTHLHFYTYKSARDMVLRTGWIIIENDITTVPIGLLFPFLLKPPLKYILSIFHWLTSILKGLLAYQYIFYCKNPNESNLL